MSALSNFVLRKVHVLSQLPFHPSAGVGKFLSPKTCDLLIKLQSDRLEKVNRISQGSHVHIELVVNLVDNALSRLSLYQIIEKTQDDPNQAIVYNCASQAWNTDFFLQGLTPEPLAMTDKLIAAIETNFGSVAKFKEEVILTKFISLLTFYLVYHNCFGYDGLWICLACKEPRSRSIEDPMHLQLLIPDFPKRFPSFSWKQFNL